MTNSQLWETPGSSRQEVGTVHASSNIAASLWVIDNMCSPRIGCLLSLSNSGTTRVTGPGSDWNCRETSCACLDSRQHSASLFLKKSRHQYFPSLHRVTRGAHTLGTSMLCLWGCGSRGCISLETHRDCFWTEYIIIVHDPEGWSVSYWGGGGGRILVNVFEFPIFSPLWYFSNKYFPNQTFFPRWT